MWKKKQRQPVTIFSTWRYCETHQRKGKWRQGGEERWFSSVEHNEDLFADTQSIDDVNSPSSRLRFFLLDRLVRLLCVSNGKDDGWWCVAWIIARLVVWFILYTYEWKLWRDTSDSELRFGITTSLQLYFRLTQFWIPHWYCNFSVGLSLGNCNQTKRTSILRIVKHNGRISVSIVFRYHIEWSKNLWICLHRRVQIGRRCIRHRSTWRLDLSRFTRQYHIQYYWNYTILELLLPNQQTQIYCPLLSNKFMTQTTKER